MAALCGLCIAASTAAGAPAESDQALDPALAVSFDATAPTPDGGVVVVGSAGYFRNGSTEPCQQADGYQQCTDTRVVVARFLANGSPDPSFGAGSGYVLLGPDHSEHSAGHPRPADVVVAPDGAIILYEATTARADPGQIDRLTPDGALDASFGDGGVVAFPDWPVAGYTADVLAVDSAGRVLVVDGNVRRFDPSGDPDPSFGVDGVAAVPGARGAMLALRPDDRVLVVAQPAVDSDTPSVDFVQLTADGTMDPSFGEQGVTSIPIPDPGDGPGPAYPDYHYYDPHGISLDEAGRAVVLFERSPGHGLYDLCGYDRVIRLTQGGELDASFGDAGFTAARWGCATDLELLDTGDVYWASTGFHHLEPSQLIESVLGSDGQPGGGFVPPGSALKIVGRSTIATSVSKLSDGSVVTAGTADGVGFLLAQRSDGQMLSTFGAGGLATLPKTRICSTPFEFCGYPYRSEFAQLAREGIGREISLSGRDLEMQFGCPPDIEEACDVRAVVLLHGINHRVARFPSFSIDPDLPVFVDARVKGRAGKAVRAATHLDVRATYSAAHQQDVKVTRRVKIHRH